MMRSGIMALGVALGESVPRFDVVMALIGGSLTGPLVFVLPPLMYARAKRLKAAATRNQRAIVTKMADKDDGEASDQSTITVGCLPEFLKFGKMEGNYFPNKPVENFSITATALSVGALRIR